MEVLGTISSILSLLDVVIRSSNAIHSLISNWRDVPIEIIALANEANDAKAVLNQACHLLHQIKNNPPAHTFGPAKSFASDIERQINQAIPIWSKLQDTLSKFNDQEGDALKCSKPNRLRWLKCRRKIDQMKRGLREIRVNIFELIVSSSACYGHAMDMHLVSLSTDIKNSQQLSTESSNLLQQRLNDIERRIALVSDGQEQGLYKLSEVFTSCRSALQNAQPLTASSLTCPSANSCPNADDESEPVDKCTEMSPKRFRHQVPPQKESAISGPIDVSVKYSALSHLTFHQTVPLCNVSCECVCHSGNWSRQVRYGASSPFKLVLGSLFIGYSGVPVPKISCDVSTCPGPAPESTTTIRYSFPTWFLNRVIILVFCSHSYIRRFETRITRRIPYVPGNIFSRINSKDFDGAVALLQSGQAHVNDTETRHGTSVLGAALRHPTLSRRFVRFIEFMLQRQADPHIPNDNGESAWHFAARLMLPNTPTTIASTELQSELHRLFPNPNWDIFQFTHVHKVVAGLRPLNLTKVLENPIYRTQINARDSVGETPLGLAALLGDHRAMETLLLAGADSTQPLQSATYLHPLRRAIRSQRSRCVELLLMASTTPTSVDSRGATLIHTAAASCDSLALIRSLLLSGIPLDSRNVHDCTPLSFTPLNDNYKVARFFLLQGANINNIDKDGDTPLTEAIRLNAHNCLRLFIEEGADVWTRNHRGWTVLHFAATYGDVESIQILTSGCLRGLNIQAHNIQGKTPRDCLFERQHVPHGILEAFESLLRSITAETTSLTVQCGALSYLTKFSPSENISEESRTEDKAFLYMNTSTSVKLLVWPYMWLTWSIILAWISLFILLYFISLETWSRKNSRIENCSVLYWQYESASEGEVGIYNGTEGNIEVCAIVDVEWLSLKLGSREKLASYALAFVS